MLKGFGYQKNINFYMMSSASIIKHMQSHQKECMQNESLSYIVGGKLTQHSFFGNNLTVLKKLTTIYDSIPFLGIYPKELRTCLQKR